MGKCDETRASNRLMGVAWLNCVLVVLVSLWGVLGLTKIIMGALYMNDCDGQQMLPIWLVIDAVIPLFFVIGFVMHLKEGSSDSMRLYGSVSLVIAIILFIGWSVCGAVWIYPSSKGDCDQVVRIFSTVMISINWSTCWMWINITGRLLWIHCHSSRGEKNLE